MPPVVYVPGAGTFSRRLFLVGILVCGYRLALPLLAPVIVPVLAPVLIPLMPSAIAVAAVLPIMTEPRGPGVVCPLEGNVTSAAVVVNAATARIHTRCQWTTDYTPDGDVPFFRAAHLLAGQQPTPGALCLNEPNNPGKDGDRIDAAVAARLLDGVTDICGFNTMIGLESSRQWVRDFQAAGGKEPALHGAHAYSTGASGLRALTLEWRAFLGTLGWHNPIVLTECGPRPIPVGTPPADPDDVADVLREAFAMWREGVIAGFAHFSHRYPADGGAWAAGDLLRSDGSLLPLGELYRALVAGAPLVRPVVTDKQVWFPVA